MKLWVSLIWYDETWRIGRTLYGLARVSEILNNKYKEVGIWDLIKWHQTENRTPITFVAEEIIRSLYFIPGKPVCYIPTTNDAPCYITSEGMSGGVVIAPRIGATEGEK